MALTPEERREINKANASHSTGPKSPQGRRRASLNAIKHGLRAESLALPHEDAEELRRRTDDWIECYQPQTPGDRAALDRCVYSQLQIERGARFHAATIAEQVRKAGLEWEWACDDELERLKKLLKTEPDEAVRLLKRSALGCRWMLAEWEELAEALEEEGTWVRSRRDRAIRLLGQGPENKHIKDDEDAYLLRFYVLFAHDRPMPSMVDYLTDPKTMPDTLIRTLDDWTPDPETSREMLRGIITEQTEALTALEERLRIEIEEPSRAGAEERATALRGPDGVLLARYVRMHDAMYNRAFKELTKGEGKAAKGDTPGGAEPKVHDPFGEVEVLDLAVGRAGAPNEPNPDGPIKAVPAAPGAVESPFTVLGQALVDVSRPGKVATSPSAPLPRGETPPAQGS